MTFKKRVRIGTVIDHDLQNKLKQLSADTRIPMSRLIDEALEDLIRKHSKPTK